MLLYKGKIARTLYGKQKQVTKGGHINKEFSVGSCDPVHDATTGHVVAARRTSVD